jgi:Flp pilus assembly protein TadG
MGVVKNQRGSTYVITVLTMTVILGFTALVIDIGLFFIEKTKLSNSVDAAALAGAQELPSNPELAIQVAKDYAVKNGISLNDIEVVVEEYNTVIKVNATRKVNSVFARVLGITDYQVNTVSIAKVAPVTAVYDGIRPLVVEEQNFQYGQQVVLKEEGGDGYNGNYGAVSLGGTGSSVFLNNIKYGYKGKLKVGQIIYTEPGNMAGDTVKGVKFINDVDSSTFENYTRDSLRLWTIPVVDSLSVDGRDYVKIVGFAEFFVEDAVYKAGKTEIIGRFIKFATNGDISDSQLNFGLMGIKLIQ